LCPESPFVWKLKIRKAPIKVMFMRGGGETLYEKRNSLKIIVEKREIITGVLKAFRRHSGGNCSGEDEFMLRRETWAFELGVVEIFAAWGGRGFGGTWRGTDPGHLIYFVGRRKCQRRLLTLGRGVEYSLPKRERDRSRG